MVTGCLFHTTALGLPRPLSAVKATRATPVPTAASRPAPQGVLVGGVRGVRGVASRKDPDGSGAARHRVTPPCPEVRRQRLGCTGAAAYRR